MTNEYTDIDEAEVAYCSVCGEEIYYDDECEFTRDGKVICHSCTYDMVLVRSVQYEGSAETVEHIVVPKAEAVTLYQMLDLPVPTQVPRYYDSRNLPKFVEFVDGAYHYIPEMKVRF